MHFQIALISDSVTDFGWVPVSELRGYVAKKRRKKERIPLKYKSADMYVGPPKIAVKPKSADKYAWLGRQT